MLKHYNPPLRRGLQCFTGIEPLYASVTTRRQAPHSPYLGRPEDLVEPVAPDYLSNRHRWIFYILVPLSIMLQFYFSSNKEEYLGPAFSRPPWKSKWIELPLATIERVRGGGIWLICVPPLPKESSFSRTPLKSELELPLVTLERASIFDLLWASRRILWRAFTVGCGPADWNLFRLTSHQWHIELC